MNDQSPSSDGRKGGRKKGKEALDTFLKENENKMGEKEGRRSFLLFRVCAGDRDECPCTTSCRKRMERGGTDLLTRGIAWGQRLTRIPTFLGVFFRKM